MTPHQLNATGFILTGATPVERGVALEFTFLDGGIALGAPQLEELARAASGGEAEVDMDRVRAFFRQGLVGTMRIVAVLPPGVLTRRRTMRALRRSAAARSRLVLSANTDTLQLMDAHREDTLLEVTIDSYELGLHVGAQGNSLTLRGGRLAQRTLTP